MENLIQRKLISSIQQKLSASKLLVLRGPKFVGKETLLRECINFQLHEQIQFIDLSDKKNRKRFQHFEQFASYLATKRVLIIKEAQHLSFLQQLIDHCLSSETIDNLVLTCSFEPPLQEEMWEAIRLNRFELLVSPLSYVESAEHFGLANEDKAIEQRLIFGYYPKVVMDPNNAENHVIELIEDAIGTNLTANERINKKEQLLKILRYLSWNIGKVISFNELGKHVGVDNETAERYVKLFEKAGLLYLLPSYSSDKRYELKKSHVVYFADNGIRNGLIRSFQAFDFRIDQQELWKNWVISERMKALKNSDKEIKSYFWNTHTKQEIDLIELESNQLTGYKIYWDKKNKLKIPSLFQSYYPTCKVSGINRSTFWNFIR